MMDEELNGELLFDEGNDEGEWPGSAASEDDEVASPLGERTPTTTGVDIAGVLWYIWTRLDGRIAPGGGRWRFRPPQPILCTPFS